MEIVKMHAAKILFMGLVFSAAIYISYRRSREFRNKTSFQVPFVRSNVSQKCTFPESIVFVKTHKTASSTAQRLIVQMIRSYDKDQAHNARVGPKPFIGGYPGYFDSDLLCLGPKNVTNDTKTGDRTEKRLTKLFGHFRFNKKEVQRLMPPETSYITIIRNPLSQFESSFWYYYRRFSKDLHYFHKHHCIGAPYIPLLNKMGANISEYIEKAATHLNTSVPWYFRSQNYQSFDLGMDPHNMDKNYIRKYVEDLDKTFDLVMISDHFWESFVLLKVAQ